MVQDQVLGSLLNWHEVERVEVHHQSEHEGEVAHACTSSERSPL